MENVCNNILKVKLMIQRLKHLREFARDEWELIGFGIGLVIFFPSTHTHGPNELWAIVRMMWWIPFLLWVNIVNSLYKKCKSMKKVKYMWVKPKPNDWVSRWGVSWKTLGIVLPIMFVVFFFVMLVVFA